MYEYLVCLCNIDAFLLIYIFFKEIYCERIYLYIYMYTCGEKHVDKYECIYLYIYLNKHVVKPQVEGSLEYLSRYIVVNSVLSSVKVGSCVLSLRVTRIDTSEL